MRLTSPSLLRCWLLLSSLLWLHDAAAWGNLGHRVTGAVAESLLTATARRQVHMLLGNESLAVAATYMDMQRARLKTRWPQADRWHYDNQPVCGQQRAPCPHGDCATRKIEQFRALLSDRHASNDERATALRLLIHMLGDIHQPLHMSDNADRGGNNLPVRLSDTGQPYNLHEVLDTVLIRELLGQQRSRDYAASLVRRYQGQLKDWQRGSVVEWAQQSHELAATHTYGKLPAFACNRHANRHANRPAIQPITLPASYLDDARAYLPRQLAKAGARIAAVLNATLK